MQVTHLGKFYPPVPGGMERVLQSLAEGERARGVDTRALVVATGRQTVRETVNGVPVTRAASMLRVGSVWFAPALVSAAGARRDRHPRAPRAEPDGAVCLWPDAPPASADHLVPQRSAPAALALPADLRAVPQRPAPPRPAHRRVRRRRSSSTPRPLQPHARRCEVIPFGLDVAAPGRRQPPVGQRRAEPMERTHRPLRRAARSLQGRRRPAARAGARRCGSGRHRRRSDARRRSSV